MKKKSQDIAGEDNAESDEEMTGKELQEEDNEETDEENINDEETDEENINEDSPDDDTVCALCDNGGQVLCCDGECNRCFHATPGQAGADSTCDTLCLSKAELAAPKFFCPNCRYKEHQCFACSELGSSDCSSAQEVFLCAAPFCGHFYHPQCVALLLYPEDEAERKNLQNKIITQGSFTCPAHKCYECKEEENILVRELRFAICRRCPRAYHKKCLPREISYEEKPGFPQRAWRNLLPRHRALIYCMKHKIQEHLLTPSKKHIMFPEKAKSSSSSTQKVLKRKRIVPEEFQRSASSKKTKQVEMLPTSSIKSEPLIDAEAKMRVKKLFDDASLSVTLSDLKRQHKAKQTKSKLVNSSNSREKDEGTYRAQAGRTASEKLEVRSDFDESLNVFDPNTLNQITNLKVVDKLLAYVHHGDTVVSVSYSANDFIYSMKKRLEESGKACSFGNYVVCEPKNGFTVEESDWLSAEKLATGSKLIICLNIPVGVSSALVNSSIEKALEYKPKLLVLFVPENIDGLEMKHKYELIWEGREELSTKILPSSIRISDEKIKLWNSKPPVFCLWSRSDWSSEHKKIAFHIPLNQNDSNVGGKEQEEEEPMEEDDEKEDEVESEEAEEEVHEEGQEDQEEKNKLRSSSPGEKQEGDEERQDEEENEDQKHEQESPLEKVTQEDFPDNLRSMSPSSSAPSEDQEDDIVFDFTPGPYRPYSHDRHSGCGWMDD